jgi:hypothetical protein
MEQPRGFYALISEGEVKDLSFCSPQNEDKGAFLLLLPTVSLKHLLCDGPSSHTGGAASICTVNDVYVTYCFINDVDYCFDVSFCFSLDPRKSRGCLGRR